MIRQRKCELFDTEPPQAVRNIVLIPVHLVYFFLSNTEGWTNLNAAFPAFIIISEDICCFP